MKWPFITTHNNGLGPKTSVRRKFIKLSNYSYRITASRSWTKHWHIHQRLRKTKRFLLGPNERGSLPMPEFFGPFSRSAFLVNNKSLFLQKCQCIDFWTVFSCPGQLNRWPCHWLSEWVSQWVSESSFDFSVKCISHLDNSSICSDCKIKSLS